MNLSSCQAIDAVTAAILPSHYSLRIHSILDPYRKENPLPARVQLMWCRQALAVHQPQQVLGLPQILRLIHALRDDLVALHGGNQFCPPLVR